MAEKKIKRRNPVVLKLYKIFFIAVFILWIIFAFKHCFPYSPFYNFNSSAPASYESYEEYINVIKKYEKECNAQFKRELFWEELGKNAQKALGIQRGYGHSDYWISNGYFYFDYGETNNPANGIKESDVIKNDGQYLYIFSENQSVDLNTYPYTLLEGAVTIVETSSSGEMDVVYKINLVSGKTGEKERKYKNLYVIGQNLVVLSYEYEYDKRYSVVTWVDIYDITDKYKPIHKRAIILDGYLNNSYERDGILYLFTLKTMNWYDNNYQNNYYSYYYEDYIQRTDITDQERYVPFYYDTAYGGKQYVPADRLHTLIAKVTKNNFNNILSTINIAAINLNDNTPVEISSYTYVYNYQSPQFYISEKNNIYLMMYKWEKGMPTGYTNILKLSVDKTDIKYVASKKIPGWINNQFSSDEYEGNFRIVTTESYGMNNYSHLFIFDENLNFISHFMKMPIKGQFKSMCFDGDVGYIITSFNDTDPMFILDLSDPKSPEITAQIKPPFYLQYYSKSYLQPLEGGLLLGLYDISGYGNIKASLFDMSDPYNPKEISVLKLGGYLSYTDIGDNHKSFLNITRYSMFSMRGRFTDIAQPEHTYDNKIQALLISYDKNDGLKLVQAFDGVDCDYPSNTYFYEYYHNYSTINRITYINNIMYHFDGEAVNAYDMNDNYKKLGSIYY